MGGQERARWTLWEQGRTAKVPIEIAALIISLNRWWLMGRTSGGARPARFPEWGVAAPHAAGWVQSGPQSDFHARTHRPAALSQRTICAQVRGALEERARRFSCGQPSSAIKLGLLCNAYGWICGCVRASESFWGRTPQTKLLIGITSGVWNLSLADNLVTSRCLLPSSCWLHQSHLCR